MTNKKITKLIYYEKVLSNNLEILIFLLSALFKINPNEFKQIKLIKTSLSNTIITNNNKEILVSIDQIKDYLLIELLIKKEFYESKIKDNFIETKIFQDLDYNLSIKLTLENLNKLIERKFYYDQNNNILTKKYSTINIDLNKCYKLYLNNKYQDYQDFKNLILFSSILLTSNLKEALNILNLLKIKHSIKNKLLKVIKQEYNVT